MTDSILRTTKKALGLDEDYSPFDAEITMHINAALATLNQIGIGPEYGFFITDDSEEWVTFLGDDPRYNSAKLFVYLQTRVLFDPPTTSFVLTAMKEQIEQQLFRLNVLREHTEWTSPNATAVLPQGPILDGGTP